MLSIAIREFPSLALRYLMEGMKTVQEIRLANLRALIDQYGGAVKFAVKVDKAQSMVSQWSNESIDSKTKKPRKITEFVARHIEAALDMQRGWMDNDHQPSEIEAVVEEDPNFSREEIEQAMAELDKRSNRGQAISAILKSLSREPAPNSKVKKAYYGKNDPRKVARYNRPTLFNDDFSGPRKG